MIYPEADAGVRAAHLVSGRMLDFIEFDDDFAIVKMYPPRETVGFTLDESKVRSKYGVTIVGVKSPGEDFTYARPETKVSSRDMLIVSGHVDLLERFAARPERCPRPPGGRRGARRRQARRGLPGLVQAELPGDFRRACGGGAGAVGDDGRQPRSLNVAMARSVVPLGLVTALRSAAGIRARLGQHEARPRRRFPGPAAATARGPVPVRRRRPPWPRPGRTRRPGPSR